MDYSNIVVIFGSITGIDQIAELSDNQAFSFQPPQLNEDPHGRWHNDISDPQPPFFCLRWRENMANPTKGWVFGRPGGSARCEFHIATGEMLNVSENHFQIDIDPRHGVPRVKVISGENSVRVQLSTSESADTLYQGQVRLISSPLTVSLGTTSMQVWRPKLTQEETKRWTEHARAFAKHFDRHHPRRISNVLQDSKKTTHLSRFGRGGR